MHHVYKMQRMQFEPCCSIQRVLYIFIAYVQHIRTEYVYSSSIFHGIYTILIETVKLCRAMTKIQIP